MVKLAMAYDLVRWEEKAIAEAARKKGVEMRMVDARTLYFDLNDRLSIDFGDLVLQRCVSYYRGLHLTAILESQGIPVVNDLRSATIAGNKLLTDLALRKAGVSTPRTILAFTPEVSLKALDVLGYPSIVKPTVGSWGRLVSPLKDPDSAKAIFEHREELHPLYQIYYLQEWVNRPPRDIRAVVLGDELICAIYRTASLGEWRTNTARGGGAVNCPITPELEALCVRAAKAIGDGFFGVDLMEGPNGLVVHEVNHTVEFRNTAPATGVDIPSLLIDYLVKKAKKGAPQSLRKPSSKPPRPSKS